MSSNVSVLVTEDVTECRRPRFITGLTHKPGHAVAQLVKALRYKPESRGFDSRWCHWNFSLT